MLEVRAESDGARVVLWTRGELDMATASTLADAISRALAADRVHEVVIDLGAVTLLDSSGVRALLQGRTAATGQGATLTVRRAHGVVGEVLQVTNVAPLFGLSRRPE